MTTNPRSSRNSLMMFQKPALLFSFFFCASLLLAQESPVQGDDLLKCLGQPKNSELVSKLNHFIGNKDTKDEISFLNYGKGIQINIQRSIVKSLDLYSEANPYSSEFKRFPGQLPLEITFDNTIFQTKKKIGEGFESSGNAEGTLQLIKVFRLNENDDYRMTVEFKTGKMIMLSLAYIEGGAGGTDSLGNETVKNPTGFRGNDFFTMMNKNKYNLEFTRLAEMLGDFTVENRMRRLYAEGGVDVEFKDGHIKRLTLYSGGQRCDYKDMSFQPYQFDLPYGLRMENTKSAIIKKLGAPASDTGNSVTYRERIVNFTIAFKGEKIDYVKFEVEK